MNASDGDRAARDTSAARPARSGLAASATEVVRSLARLEALLARRRVAAALLAAAAAAALVLALAALAARFGLLASAAWAPLAAWIAALAAALAAARPAWGVRVRRGAALRDTAALVEREQALRRGSLVGIVDAAALTPAGASPALVARAAERVARALPPEASWAPEAARRLSRRLRAGAAACAAAAALAVFAFAWAGDAAAELVSPLRALAASLGARVQVAVSPPAVRRGGAVVVSVRSPAIADARLFVRETGETWRAVPLAAAGPDRATARLAGLTAPVFVYARSGGRASDTLRVGVIEPPFVTELAVTARFPAYLERQDETLPPDSGPVALPEGTVLALRGVASATVSAAALVGPERRALSASGRGFAGDLVVRRTATWRLVLADASGEPFPGPLPVFDLRAVPDSAPVVALPVPGADTTAPLDLRLPLVVDARDDHALASVEIVSWRVSRLGTVGARTVDTVAGVAGADHVVESVLLDLNGRGLLPGDTLRLFARATDRAPQPHRASSREYAVRLRSMAELRDAVRAAGDTLARRASDLAGDAAALSRRTGDLAAQRNRGAGGADSTGAPVGDQTQRSGAPLPFEQAQEAGRVRDEQQRLLERTDSLRQALAGVAAAAQRAGLTDSAWQQRLRELDQLLQQAVTPELRARLEQLRSALEHLDPRAVEQALRQLAESQLEMRRQLERSAELFQRAALEGSLQTYAQNAEALRQAELQWADRAAAAQDTAAAAEEQRTLGREADTLHSGLEALGPRLTQRGDSAGAGTVAWAERQVAQAGAKMEDAGAAMSAGRRQDAGPRGAEAADALRGVGDSLRGREAQMAAAWRAEVLKLLRSAEAETIALAVEEQGMAERLRRGEGSGDASGQQSALEQGVDQVARRLGEASGRNALVSPQLGAALGLARQQIEQSRRALEAPRTDPAAAASRAQDAAQALSSAAFQIMRSGDDVAGAQSGSGFAEALKRMAELATRQGALDGQLNGLLPMLGPGSFSEAVMQQLREIAARQRALANEMERLRGMGLQGRPEDLAEEARRLADRLEQGQLDRRTLERQQQLFRHMLDAGRSLQSDEEDAERKSETAREHAASVPVGTVPREPGLRYPIPKWDQLKSLSPAERAMVLDYFRRINAAGR